MHTLKTIYEHVQYLCNEYGHDIVNRIFFRYQTKASKHIIFHPEFSDVNKCVMFSNNIDLYVATELAKKTHPSIKRGDVVFFIETPYENEGKVIWDGTKCVELDYTIDGRGSVPSCFNVGEEFPIDYWEDVIIGNTIVHLDDDITDNLIVKMDGSSHISVRGKEYRISFEPSEKEEFLKDTLFDSRKHYICTVKEESSIEFILCNKDIDFEFGSDSEYW